MSNYIVRSNIVNEITPLNKAIKSRATKYYEKQNYSIRMFNYIIFNIYNSKCLNKNRKKYVFIVIYLYMYRQRRKMVSTKICKLFSDRLTQKQ